MRLFVLMLVAMTVLPIKAQAQKTGALISGGYLLELCKRDTDGGELVEGSHIACQSYIAGLVDYHNLLRSLGTSPNLNLCVPPNVKLNDLQDIVWKYLSKNSHHDEFIAAPAVSLALHQYFPCKKKKK